MIFEFRKLLVVILAGAPLAGAVAGGSDHAFDDTLAPPQIVSAIGENPFEKQFVGDTGATNRPRAEIFRRFELGALPAKSDLTFRFKLNRWPKASQSAARLWVAIGATNTISTDGSLGLSFLQNGNGMSTDLNNSYNVDGTMVLGSDFAFTNGIITVEIQNKTHLPNVAFTVCAIAYLPPPPAAAPAHP